MKKEQNYPEVIPEPQFDPAPPTPAGVPIPECLEEPRETPAITFETIFGNLATIMLASIVEMIWHNTGYCEIFTPCGVYIVPMSREGFDDINRQRSSRKEE